MSTAKVLHAPSTSQSETLNAMIHRLLPRVSVLMHAAGSGRGTEGRGNGGVRPPRILGTPRRRARGPAGEAVARPGPHGGGRQAERGEPPRRGVPAPEPHAGARRGGARRRGAGGGRPERRLPLLLRRRRPEEAQGAVPRMDQGLQGPAAQDQGRARQQGRAASGQLLDLNLSRMEFVYE
jgi:hypothetical protein